MYCEICKSENSPIIVVLPLRQEDGQLSTMACMNCAEKSSVFCNKHGRPHLGFNDGSTACIFCIEEVVIAKQHEIPVILTTLGTQLPQKQYQRLLDWANFVSTMGKTMGADFGPTQICILRALATKAMRSQTDIEEVVAMLIKTKSVSSIIPTPERF